MMAIIVDPNDFKVPYAISADGTLHQIGDGRPAAPEIFCPLCRTAVAFVRETDARAAHFRHNTREQCDVLAAYHRETLHNAVRDAAARLMAAGTTPRRLCRGDATLPTGRVEVEAGQALAGKTHRPDITVYPREGERAPILEMEVVYSHRPEPERVSRAARDGRMIAVLDVAPIERDYYRKLWANEAFDIPEACREYVLERRFDLLEDADIRRIIRGVLERVYLAARVLPEHIRPAPAARLTQAPAGLGLPMFPPSCSVCGGHDWRVSLTLKDGKKAHVQCVPEFAASVDKTVDKTGRQDPKSARLSDAPESGRQGRDNSSYLFRY